VAGLAFVAGRSAARPAAPAATAGPTTSTTTPEPDANHRRLGWAARLGPVTVTAVDARRVATDERETVASITLRVQGLPDGQRALALGGLRLLDAGGGVFASAEDRRFGRHVGAPVRQSDRDPDSYSLVTGSAPRLSSLARIELDSVDVSSALDFVRVQGVELRLRVASAFVGAGQAVVVVDVAGFQGAPGEALPLAAELRAGDRVLCGRTLLLGRDGPPEGVQGVVLSCPARPAPRLTVALGAGARAVPFDATLRR
jgi:hypothetical protein